MRVHELAKELNLKSQELLDLIQKWGLDVKVSALASLDPSMVDRIKALKEHPSDGNKAESSSPAPGQLSEAEPHPAPGIRPSATAQSTALGPKPAGPPSAGGPARSAPTEPPATAATQGVMAAPPPVGLDADSPARQRLIPGSSPVARPPAPSPAAIAPTPAGPRPTAPAQAPLSRPGGGFSGNRPSGPLSAHTPHRGTGPGGGPRPGGGPTPASPGARHGQPGAQPPSASPGGGSSFQPLKQSDYMSSAGIRPMTPRVTPPSTPSSSSSLGAPRRPIGESGADGNRRDREPTRGTSRPLPNVAAPTLPPQRQGGPQRPASGTPAGKTQRPEKKMTPEEIMAFRRSGQVPSTHTPPGGPSGPGTGQGARPGQLLRGSGPSPGPARHGTGPPPPGGPAMRRPLGPGMPAPAPPPPPVIDDEEERKKAGRLGSAADRAGRRARRSERAGERRVVTSPVPAAALLEMDDGDVRRSRSGGKKHRGGQRAALAPTRKAHAEVEPPITVRTLSEAIGVKARDLIHKLMAMNQLATINAFLEDDLAVMLALEFGIELEVVHQRTAEDDLLEAFASSRLVGESDATPPGNHHPGPRRPRKDLAAGPHPQVERRPVREWRHHPAHRRLPG